MAVSISTYNYKRVSLGQMVKTVYRDADSVSMDRLPVINIWAMSREKAKMHAGILCSQMRHRYDTASTKLLLI